MSKSQAYIKFLDSMNLFATIGRTIDEFQLVDFAVGARDEQIYDQDYQHEQNYLISMKDLESIKELNSKQKRAFDDISEIIHTNDCSIFFVDGLAGTGKTYLYRALLA